MKAGWQVRPLADIADCCLGKMLDKQKNRGQPQPYLRNVNVRWFEFDLVDLLEMPFEASEQERYSIRKGDLVICEGGYPGRCAIWEDDEPVFFQKALHRVRCHEPERAKWLQYFLWMSDADGSLRPHFTGSGIQHLTGQALARLKIPLPPLEEQRRIVAVLDEAFAAIASATANAEKNLVSAQELFGAVFAQTLIEPGAGWSVGEIRNVADLISGQHIEASDYNKAQRGIGYLTGPSDFGERTPVVTKWTEHPKRTALRGDILITVKGSGVGSVNVMEEDELAISRQLMAVRVKHTDPELVYYALEAGFDHFQKLATGAAIPGISRNNVLDFKIAIPPASEQLDLMGRLHALRATATQLTENYRQRMFNLTALKKSLLHRAFAGELATEKPQSMVANDNFASPKGSAQIIAFAYWLHKRASRDKSYKHVKAQKCLHNVENIAAIELGRQPRKFPYGPHDPVHMARAEDWARQNGFFEFVPSTSGQGLDFRKLANYDALMAEALAVTAPLKAALERAIAPLVPMNMEEAELFATVHAAWNNLLHDGAVISDDAIVTEARENWDQAKTNIPRQKFIDTIKLVRRKRMEPDGSGKYVGGQARLL